jgi:hypothetical protein
LPPGPPEFSEPSHGDCDIVLGMAMAVMLKPLNAILADPATPDYANVAAVVAGATSCRDAVDQLGVLEGLPPEVMPEVDAVFAAMSAEVDHGILGALRAGFARRSSMALLWDEETSEGQPTVAHRVDEQGDRLYVHVIAPNGQQFLTD